MLNGQIIAASTDEPSVQTEGSHPTRSHNQCTVDAGLRLLGSRRTWSSGLQPRHERLVIQEIPGVFLWKGPSRNARATFLWSAKGMLGLRAVPRSDSCPDRSVRLPARLHQDTSLGDQQALTTDSSSPDTALLSAAPVRRPPEYRERGCSIPLTARPP